MAGQAATGIRTGETTQKVRRTRKTDVVAPEPDKPRRRATPRIKLPPRLREEITAVLVFTVAVITALPQVGLADDTLLSVLTDGIAALIGRAVLLVPFAISIVAVEIWRAEEAEQRVRRTLGGVLATLAIIGLLTLAQPQAPVQEAGGYVGDLLSFSLRAIIGEIGASLLLLSVGIVAVFLVTGTDVSSMRESWARITYRPPVYDEDEPDDDEQPVLEFSDPVLPVTTDRYDSVKKTDNAVDASASVEPPVKTAPYINVPKPDKKAEVPQAARDKPLELEDPDTPPSPATPWRLPKLGLLELYKSSDPDAVDLEKKARRIEETLSSFKVEATVREIFPGPAVTLFALEPALGVKVRRITELQNDLALALAAPSIRLEAPVPGMARVGIEIPNASVSTVGLREVLESETFQTTEAKLPMPLGRDVNGRYVIGDLTRMPHLLIAGATGSGKSVCINSIIATFLLTKTPDELQMILIDPKMVELVGFERVPHLKGPVVTDMDKVVGALRMVLREMERRYQLFARLGVRNIDGYNLRREDEPQLDKMPYLVVVIDELADLMMTTPEEVETLLVRLAQMARATGIHLLIATQRPSVDVLTGLIKANVPARVAFAVTSLTDSRVVLDMPGAERLLGRGDMLFMPPDAAKPHRIQGPYIDDKDLEKVVLHWRKLVPELHFDPEWSAFPSAGQQQDEDGDDALMEQAIEIVRQQGTASASMLQRRLRVGYNRAARMIESMEDAGLIGPADGQRGRTVLLELDDE